MPKSEAINPVPSRKAGPEPVTASGWAQLKELVASSITLKKLNELIVSLGGRRFILSCGAGIVSSVLVWYAKITPEIYRDVILGTVGMYIAGNTFQKVRTPEEHSPK